MNTKRSPLIHNRKLIPVGVFVFVMIPMIASAAGLVQCGNPGQPACDFNQLATLINNIINWFLGISVSVAAITFAVAGAQILMNQDKPAKLEDAKGIFGKTILGLIVILAAWLVIHTVIAALVNPSTGALRFLGS